MKKLLVAVFLCALCVSAERSGVPIFVGVAYSEDKKPQDTDKINQLIQKLGDDDFQTREKAQAELIKMGKTIEPILKRALSNTTDPEIKNRLKIILEKLAWGEPVNGLKMALVSDKEKYKTDEVIRLVCKILNTTDKEITLSGGIQLAPAVLFKVDAKHKATNKTTTIPVRNAEAMTPAWQELKPKEIIEISLADINIKTLQLKTGEYEIVAKYKYSPYAKRK